MQADSINNYDNSGRTQYRFIAEWRDLSSEGNYYRISAEKKETNSASHYYYLQLGDDKNLIHDDVAAVNTYKKEAVFFDYGDNNQDFEFTAYVYLLKTDVYYYHYHKSVQTYQDENPFAEPTLTYSNITGGLGVFCAYNQTTVAIEL